MLIGVAMVLDTLDGFFARLTHSTSAFGVELDSLADVVSFGWRPRSSRSAGDCGRSGARVGGRVHLVTAAAMRLARFNIQTSTLTDKRYFAGMPSPAARAVIASTVYLYPWGLQDPRAAAFALAMVLVPAFLMVSTIRFRSVKAIDVGWRRSPRSCSSAPSRSRVIASHPRVALVVLSYSYIVAALAMLAYARLRRRPVTTPPAG